MVQLNYFKGLNQKPRTYSASLLCLSPLRCLFLSIFWEINDSKAEWQRKTKAQWIRKGTSSPYSCLRPQLPSASSYFQSFLFDLILLVQTGAWWGSDSRWRLQKRLARAGFTSHPFHQTQVQARSLDWGLSFRFLTRSWLWKIFFWLVMRFTGGQMHPGAHMGPFFWCIRNMLTHTSLGHLLLAIVRCVWVH